MKTEAEAWAGHRQLTQDDTFQKGDLRSAKSDYTYSEKIPDAWIGKKVHPDAETDWIYYRPL